MVDLAAALVAYALLTFVWNQTFSFAILGLTIFFALSPDLDFIPFVFLRKRLNLISHWLIHYPLLFIPAGALVVLALGGNGYIISLFVTVVLFHFVHDSVAGPGIRWLWPLKKTSYTIRSFRIISVSEEERVEFYKKWIPGASKRNVIDEITMRLGHELNLTNLALLAIGLGLVILIATRT